MNSNCYNTDCPFRQCGSTNPYYCVCFACPHRYSGDELVLIATDHTTPLDEQSGRSEAEKVG